MRHRRVAFVSLLSVLVPAALAAQSDTRPGVAVFPLANGGSYGASKEDLDALGVGLQQMLMTELSQNSSLRIIERGMIRELLAEQDLGASGRVDPQTAARVGKLVGARYSVLGGFTDLNGDFRMDARIVDTETSEVIKAEQVRDDRAKLYDLVIRMSGLLTRGANLPPLAGEIREARAKRTIPPEAIAMYSRAQVYQDGGRTERAVELYRQISEKFPDMTEAKEALKQLQSE